MKKTYNDYNRDTETLTQIQTNKDGADIVTHFDKGSDPVDHHEVVSVDKDGNAEKKD